jgi:hypothetical protein
MKAILGVAVAATLAAALAAYVVAELPQHYYTNQREESCRDTMGVLAFRGIGMTLEDCRREYDAASCRTHEDPYACIRLKQD